MHGLVHVARTPGQWWSALFSVAAITNKHVFSGLKQHSSIIPQSHGPEVQENMAWLVLSFRLHRSKIKTWAGLFLSADFGDESTYKLIQIVGKTQSHAIIRMGLPFPCLLLARSQSQLLEATCITWLVFKASSPSRILIL